jgi:phosphotransferase system, enzyme I, PtsP
MVRSLDAARVRLRVEQLLDKPPASMRKTLSDWARRHKVAID